MSAKDAPVPATASGTPPGALEIAWRSQIYSRLQLTQDQLVRLSERFIGAGILTSEDLNRELHKAACWCRDNPVRANRKRNWYKFLNNWFSRAEEVKRSRVQKSGRRSDRRGAPDEHDHEATRTAIREARRPF